MIIEVNGQRYELEWKGISILLSLLWVKLGALPFTRFQTIEPDLGRLRCLIKRLKEEGLIEEVKVGKTSFVYLTDLGIKVAEYLENKARELDLL